VQMPKPTDADRERFLSLVPSTPGVEVKPMFGNVGAFVNGNMFMGLLGADIGIRLAAPHRERLLAEPGSAPFGPSERPMRDYVTLPADWSLAEAGPWIELAFSDAAALPPKQAKPRAAKKATKSKRS
jgi:TfoX/Sxy family transcriptional regulator of competence genes